jgi:hypothetical protein
MMSMLLISMIDYCMLTVDIFEVEIEQYTMTTDEYE